MNSNKNPLNIKGREKWAGKIGNDSRGHCIFSDPAYGIRAGMRTLQSKWKNCKTTLADICADWAPVSDTQGSIAGRPANDPGDYARYVAERVWIGDHAALPDPMVDTIIWTRIVRAMAKYEMGEECPLSVVLRGVALWLEDFVEGK